MLFRKSLMTAMALMVASAGSQAFAAFQDPATASWGGWDRNTGATIYVHWDDFAYDPDPAPALTDGTPDVNSYGVAIAGVTANNPTTLVTSTENLYTPAGPANFTVSVIADVLLDESANGVTVALQLATLGTQLDASSVFLTDGVNSPIIPDSAESSFSAGFTEWLFLWNLDADVSTYFFNFSSMTNNLSLAAVSVDIGPSPVPVPAAVWLFGSALLGLGAMRKKG
ncbi:MAG: VPLPA-CTERM sorting domain-containing protein [Pseudomonadota bacterium]